MSDLFELNAELRTDEGKGASRRLRRLNAKVPAIIYGEGQEPQSISIALKDLSKSLESEAFYSHVLTINLDGKAQSAVLKDLQRHPSKGFPLHADFLRIDKDHEIHMNVPLHFINEDKCVGVKIQGGTIAHQAQEAEVVCLPANLPEYIEVDMEKVETGQIIHLSDIPLPEGVVFAALTHGDDHNLAVANVIVARGSSASDDEEGEASDGEGEADA